MLVQQNNKRNTKCTDVFELVFTRSIVNGSNQIVILINIWMNHSFRFSSQDSSKSREFSLRLETNGFVGQIVLAQIDLRLGPKVWTRQKEVTEWRTWDTKLKSGALRSSEAVTLTSKYKWKFRRRNEGRKSFH
jgi:hypothetical protein